MEVFVFLFIYVLWAFLCAGMAKRRGRNTLLGFIGGLIFGIFTVLYYWAAGKSERMIKDEKEEEYRRLAMILNSKKA